MTILVFGRTGQVAQELQRRAPADTTFLSRQDVDLEDAAACVHAINTRRARAVINAAAFTGVDAAEDDEAKAQTINADAPAAMARACATRGIAFLHLSTDYVFDGSGTAPYRPFDLAQPLGAYGRSKLAAEVAVRSAGGTHAILRTSWVFSAHGRNFVRTMLRLGAERDQLDIVADQIGGPTPAGAIADALLRMATVLLEKPSSTGTYHLSGAPDVSWADFAKEIFRQAGQKVSIHEISTEAFPTRAIRPKNSRLDCSSLKEHFGIDRPDWRLALAGVVAELGTMPA